MIESSIIILIVNTNKEKEFYFVLFSLTFGYLVSFNRSDLTMGIICVSFLSKTSVTYIRVCVCWWERRIYSSETFHIRFWRHTSDSLRGSNLIEHYWRKMEFVPIFFHMWTLREKKVKEKIYEVFGIEIMLLYSLTLCIFDCDTMREKRNELDETEYPKNRP